jgi:predicted XRE-type DNA-binding protein
MSKNHPYRVQLHCSKHLYKQIKNFAEQRGLSQSAAARILVERSINSTNDEISSRLDEQHRLLNLILHASSASRILAAEAVSKSGSTLDADELRERVNKLVERYKTIGLQP